MRRAIDVTSVRSVARVLGLSAEATVRLAGGLPVQRGSLSLAEKSAPALTTLIAEAS